MMTLVIGGSGSGKSAYAEELLLSVAGEGTEKYYLATMEVRDAESRRKVERHRRKRAGKGFQTIEQPRDLARILPQIQAERACGSVAVLLECMSNLVANEMFSAASTGEALPAGTVAAKVLQDLRLLADAADELVIVSNNVFEDGAGYDPLTLAYLGALAAVNERVADLADCMVEVVVGIPIEICRD